MTTIIKREDRIRLRWQIISNEGIPQNLTDATVRLLLRGKLDESAQTTSINLQIEGDPDLGIVFWENNGTLEEGLYDYEIEVSKSSYRQTAPSGGYGLLYVKQDLG